MTRDATGALGAYTYALVGAFAFLETGAGVGLVAPGELVVILGGVSAGQGEIQLVPFDSDRVAVRAGGRRDLPCARAAAGPSVSGPSRTVGRDHRRSSGAGGALLCRARRQDDHSRAVHRPGPGPGAVHRRRFPDAGPTLHPLHHPRRQPWAGAFCVLGYAFWRALDLDQLLAVPGRERSRSAPSSRSGWACCCSTAGCAPGARPATGRGVAMRLSRRPRAGRRRVGADPRHGHRSARARCPGRGPPVRECWVPGGRRLVGVLHRCGAGVWGRASAPWLAGISPASISPATSSRRACQ
jgi:hypothetical protein